MANWMKQHAERAKSIQVTDEDQRKASESPSTGPRTAPGQLMHQQATVERQRGEIEQLKKELESAKRSGSTVEVPLADLHEVEGRRRFMSQQKYEELRENLRHNKLVHPVVVLPRDEGGFEIVSGHHRSDAYRELGRETIRCVLGDATAEEADEGAFFANLMQSDLTDYEKYVGLKRFQEQHPNLTQVDVSTRVGISQAHVSALLSFGRLPAKALAIVEANKAILGAKTAAELAAIADGGKAAKVVEATQQLADKKLDQMQAVRFARVGDAPKVTKPAAASYKVKTGKSTWCDVRTAKNVMRIEFQSEEVTKSVAEAIKQHLETLASKS